VIVNKENAPTMSEATRARILAKGDQVMEEMAAEFHRELPAILTQLQGAADNKDLETIKRSAYQLKSSASGFGKSTLGQGASFLHVLAERGASKPEVFLLAGHLINFLKELALIDESAGYEESEETVSIMKAMYHELSALGLLD